MPDRLLPRCREALLEARALASEGKVQDAFYRLTTVVALAQTVEHVLELGLVHNDYFAGPIRELLDDFYPDSEKTDQASPVWVLVVASYHETIEHAISGGLNADAFYTIEGLKSRRLFRTLARMQAQAQGVEAVPMGPGDFDSKNLEFVLSTSDYPTGVLALFQSSTTGILHAFTLFNWDKSSRCDRWEILTSNDSSRIALATRSYIKSIENDGPRAAQPRLRTILEDLGRRLREPIEQLLKLGVKRLIVVPHGIFHLLPLHAVVIDLRGREESPVSLFDSVVFSPSLWLYTLTLTDKNVATWSWEILGSFDTEDLLFSTAGFVYFDYTYQKASPTLLLNPSISTLEGHLPGKTLLHLDCHGQASEKDFMESKVLFAGGSLSFREILERISFDRTQLVFLNACSSGVNFNPDRLSDEYYGLDGAILAKGALSVISTFATVYDDAAFLVAFRMYVNHHEEGMDPSTALQRAQCWLRDGAWKTCEKLRLFLRLLESVGNGSDPYVAPRAEQCRKRLQRILREESEDYFRPEVYWAQWKCSGYGGATIPFYALSFGPLDF